MTLSPIEHAQSLRIGAVEFVSPNEIKVLLDIEAPESVVLNVGNPRPFPRINGYLLIPNDEGYLVGQIEWLSVEHSAFPKRRGMIDFGLVDLPYPLRKLSLNPLGTLKATDRIDEYKFSRGVEAFPSIGDGVFLPTDRQLRSVIESGPTRKIKIGTSPLADSAGVCIDPDRLFGRHLAVLGNTGSGKSCSVAGLIRWSLKEAQKQTIDSSGNPICPNAKFIILDPNGEYARAFGNQNDDCIKAKIFRVESPDVPMSCGLPLQIPLWFWNSAEWCSFTQASAKMQRPLLRRALREIRSGGNLAALSEEEKKIQFRRYLSSNLISINRDVDSGHIRTEPSKFGFFLKAVENDLRLKSTSEYSEYKDHIDIIRNQISPLLQSAYKSFNEKGTNKLVEYYSAFEEVPVKGVIEAFTNLLNQLGGIIYQEGPSEDIPIPFKGAEFADHIQILAEQEGVSQYVDFLVMRIRTMLADTRMKSIIADNTEITLESWLKEYIGISNEDDESFNLSIIDLSLVPAEVVHIIVAVTARIIFEALQRYRKINTKSLPTVLVMEEAHTFIKRYKDDLENQDAASVCCQVFEKIAREGRKFGLGLVLSSQRPSELSPTVLSQCNSFLLHRINNDRDQELIHRLIPDNLRGLLRELPSLPSQNAILLGWASELPVLVRMNDLPENQQPQSDDPDFWNVWSRQEPRDADWGAIVRDWEGG